MSRYSTNLTDKQWQVIEKIINPQERQRRHQHREIMNAILYINKTGCQWRMLPSHFAPWQTVYYYFRKWKQEGVIEDIMDTLHSLARKMIGREESPSMGIIDSRSVKTDQRKYRVESLMMVKRLPHLPAAPGICLFNRLAPLDPFHAAHGSLPLTVPRVAWVSETYAYPLRQMLMHKRW